MYWRSNELIVMVRKETYETHYVISLSGEVRQRLEWRAYGYEDDLYTTAHVVENGQLIERSTTEGPYHPLIKEDKVLASGLRPVSDEATKQLVASALAKAAAAAEREREARERAGMVRVAGLTGANDRLRGGPLVDRAQDALINRIERHADESAARLLKTLITVTAAEVSAEVLQAYARGCLSACFESDLPPLPQTPTKSPNALLARELRQRVQELDADADYKEFMDAMGTAAALSRAARAIEWAAEQLSASPSAPSVT